MIFFYLLLWLLFQMSKNFVQEFCNLSVGQRKIFLLFMITNWFLALNISSLCCWYDNFPIPPLFLNLRILYLILNLNTRIYKVSNLYLVKFQILTYKWICIFFWFLDCLPKVSHTHTYTPTDTYEFVPFFILFLYWAPILNTYFDLSWFLLEFEFAFCFYTRRYPIVAT